MSNKNQHRERMFHRIPNPQVLDAAAQFHNAYKFLDGLPPSGVLLPQLHCGFIAMELYLKSLSAKEVEVPDTVAGFGAFIYAESPARSHSLGELFDLVDPSHRRRLDQDFARRPRLSDFPSARDALVQHNALILASRYPFEADSALHGIEMGRLAAILSGLEKVTGDLRRGG